jgi:hypothetical protein
VRRRLKIQSDEVIVLRALLAKSDELAMVLETGPVTRSELVGHDTITPDLLHRALSMAVKCVERSHDAVAAEGDAVSLYLQATVAFAKQAGHQSHRDVVAAVHYHTGAARETVRKKAARLIDQSKRTGASDALKKFAKAWDRLKGTQFGKNK